MNSDPLMFFVVYVLEFIFRKCNISTMSRYKYSVPLFTSQMLFHTVFSQSIIYKDLLNVISCAKTCQQLIP